MHPSSSFFDEEKHSITRGLKTIIKRWPDLHKGYAADPVFIMSAGPGCGVSRLQRALRPGCLVWGDPFIQHSPVEALADHVRMFNNNWPPDNFFISPQLRFTSTYRPAPNLYPLPGALLKAHRTFFERLFADSARRRGAFAWGVYGSTWNADHAFYLKWLFPNSKILFLYRSPLHAYQAYCSEQAHRPSSAKPVTPKLRPQEFAAVWSEAVSTFLEQHKQLNSLAVAYEQLENPDTRSKIETYLGFHIGEIPSADGINQPITKLPVISGMDVSELQEFEEVVRPQAGQLGYSLFFPVPPVQAHGASGDSQQTRKENSKCAVLVPYMDHIDPQCEQVLRALEDRGYVVRRVHGFTAIDVARNVLATQALDDGFEQILWVDDDMYFHPEAVDRLRSHNEPLIGGLVAKRGQRSFASMFHGDTDKITLGKGGGIIEVLQMGTGFLLVHREVFENIQKTFELPRCVEKSGRPCVPYFMPAVIPVHDGHWYLAEDYSFVYRAKECGYRMLADTTIRLGHIGSYEYSWEDVGIAKPRFDSFDYAL